MAIGGEENRSLTHGFHQDAIRMLGPLQGKNLLPFRTRNDKGVYFAAVNSLQRIFGFFKAKPEGFDFA